jgi:hypothetical protein
MWLGKMLVACAAIVNLFPVKGRLDDDEIGWSASSYRCFSEFGFDHETEAE